MSKRAKKYLGYLGKQKYKESKYSITTGLDRHGWNVLHNAIYYGDLDKIKELSQNEELFIKQNKQKAKNEVSSDPRDHLYSLMTLHICCDPFDKSDIQNAIKIYDIILSIYLKKNMDLQPCTYQLNTPLHFACRNNFEYIANSLIFQIFKNTDQIDITTVKHNLETKMFYRPNEFLVTPMNLIQDNIKILETFMQLSHNDNDDLKQLKIELDRKPDENVIRYPLDSIPLLNRTIMTKRAFIFDQTMTFMDIHGMYPIHDYAFDRKLNLIIFLSNTKYINQLDDRSRTALYYLFVIKYYKFNDQKKLAQRKEKIDIFNKEYKEKRGFYLQLFNTMELLCKKMDLNIFFNTDDVRVKNPFFDRIVKIMPDTKEYHQALINCMLIIKDRVLALNDSSLRLDIIEMFRSVLSTYITCYQDVKMKEMPLEPWLNYVENRDTQKTENLTIDESKIVNKTKRARVIQSGAERYIDYLQFYNLI